ncbi:MAG: hypothetical protein F6K58_13840 [Symploca sp. SIO2E9]|nr:hypothetical protein [Symploca sp. SIO2E9]
MTYRLITSPQNHRRPWRIVRTLPNCQHHTIARFFNRQDAEDHLRMLHRFMPKAVFEIVFEPPEQTSIRCQPNP